MISKAIIKDIQNLARRDHRDAQKLFLAEGVKWMEELLTHAPSQIQCIYATADWIQANKTSLSGIPHEEVDEILLGRLSQLKTPQQVLAVVRHFELEKPSISAGIHLVLDTIQDPGNMGTLIRTADWFGVKQIVCSTDCADVYNPKVVQATMGSLVRMPITYAALPEWLSKQKDIRKWAAVLSGTDYRTISGNGILMMGNESKGLSDELSEIGRAHV